MVRSLTSPKINLKMTATLTNTVTDGSSTSVAHPAFNHTVTLTSGCEDNQANRAWQSADRSLAAGSQDILDLADMSGIDIGAGSGKDALGQTVDYQEIVAIVVVNENAVTDDGYLEVEPASSEGWNPIGIHTGALGGALYGQGLLIKFNPAEVGFPITANSHRITFKAVGAAVTYSVYILARDDSEQSSSSSSSSLSSSSLSSQSTSSVSTSSSSQSTSSSSSSVSSSSSSSSLSESSSSLSSQS